MLQSAKFVAFALALAGCGTTMQLGDIPDATGDAAAPPAAAAPTPTPPSGADAGSACGVCSVGETCVNGPTGAACTPDWTETGVLSVDDAQPRAAFGGAIARTDGLLLVGAPDEGSAAGPGSGAAYVFERGKDSWLRGQRLESPDVREGARFGSAVAIDDDGRLFVGAQAARWRVSNVVTEGDGHGAVHVFERQDGFYTRVVEIVAPDPALQAFGCSLAVSGDGLVVGSGDGVHLYTRDGASYRYDGARLRGTGTCPMQFGSSLAASASIVAAHTMTATSPQTASVYAIRHSPGAWGEAVLVTADPVPGPFGQTQFAWSVAVDGARVAVGKLAVGQYGGSVLLFDLAADTPSLLATCAVKDVTFGSYVALRGDRIVSNGALIDWAHGCARQEWVLDALPPQYSRFWVGDAIDVALGDDEALFGLPDDLGPGSIVRAKVGAASTSDEYAALRILSASESQAYPRRQGFGTVLALGDGVALVGTDAVNEPTAPLYVFEQSQGRFRFKQTLERPVPGYTPWGEPVLAGRTIAFGVLDAGEVRTFERAPDGLYRPAQVLAGWLTARGNTAYTMRLALDDDAMGVHQDDVLHVLGRGADGQWAETRTAPGVYEPLLFSKKRVVNRKSGGEVTVFDDEGDRFVERPLPSAPGAQALAAALTSDGVLLLTSDGNGKRTLTEYARSGDAWEKTADLALDGIAASTLVPMGDTWLLGDQTNGTGAVWIVARVDGKLALSKPLRAKNAIGDVAFGSQLAGGTGVFLVGAPNESVSAVAQAGLVHVFERRSLAPR